MEEMKLNYYQTCTVVSAHGKEKLQAATRETSTRYQKKHFLNWSDTETRAQRGAGVILGDTQNSGGQSPKLTALS